MPFLKTGNTRRKNTHTTTTSCNSFPYAWLPRYLVLTLRFARNPPPPPPWPMQTNKTGSPIALSCPRRAYTSHSLRDRITHTDISPNATAGSIRSRSRPNPNTSNSRRCRQKQNKTSEQKSKPSRPPHQCTRDTLSKKQKWLGVCALPPHPPPPKQSQGGGRVAKSLPSPSRFQNNANIYPPSYIRGGIKKTTSILPEKKIILLSTISVFFSPPREG